MMIFDIKQEPPTPEALDRERQRLRQQKKEEEPLDLLTSKLVLASLAPDEFPGKCLQYAGWVDSDPVVAAYQQLTAIGRKYGIARIDTGHKRYITLGSGRSRQK